MHADDLTAILVALAHAAAVAGFLLAGGALAIIDLATRRMPNAITGAAAIVCGGLLALASHLSGDGDAMARLVAGGLGLGAGYLVVAIASRGGLGMGDVKFAVVVGAVLAWHGWTAFWIGALGAFVLGGIAVGVRIARHRSELGDSIAFAPWMLLGALVGLTATG